MLLESYDNIFERIYILRIIVTIQFDLSIYPNNIFYNLGISQSVNWPSNITYSHNNYYGYNNYPNDTDKNIDNPRFVNPRSGKIGINTVAGYKLRPASSLINSGTMIANSGGKDYWGNTLYYDEPDIGAFENPVGNLVTPGIVENKGFEVSSELLGMLGIHQSIVLIVIQETTVEKLINMVHGSR